MQDWRSTALVGILLLVACDAKGGESPPDGEAAPVRGAALVAGSAVQDWALLVIPRSGGLAELRALEDPSRSLWAGKTPLPPSEEAYPLTDGTVILHGSRGRLYRYEPRRDALTEVGRADDPGAPASQGGRRTWIDRAESSVITVSESEVWSRSLESPVLWAAPTGDNSVVVARVAPSSPRALELALIAREPAGQSPVTVDKDRELGVSPQVALPGLVTAWGHRLVFADPGSDALLIVGLPQLRLESRVPLSAPLMALAASPSSHEIYAALGSPSRVMAIGRFSGQQRRLAELPGEVLEIRPSLLGAFLMARLADEVAFVPLDGRRGVTIQAEWRADLPLGLPGDRILARGKNGLFLWQRGSPSGGSVLAMPGPVDAWWLPVRWRPPPSRFLASGDTLGRVATPDQKGEPAPAADTVAAEDFPEPSATALAAPDSDTDAAPVSGAIGGVPAPAAREASVGSARLPPGFYVIVSSSQASGGIVTLREQLSSAGFRTLVQRHRDEANEIWYRTLVGPYDTREDAEAATRQLRRERGLRGWISEIGPDSRPETGS